MEVLAHNIHDVQVFKRHVHANRLAGIDNEWLTAEQAQESLQRMVESIQSGAISRFIAFDLHGQPVQFG